MKVIHVDEIEDGMILHKTAIASNNLELIRSGTELVQRYHHEMLARWGIETVQIEDDPTQDDIELLPESIRKKIQIKLQLLYVNSGKESILNRILKAKTSALLVKDALLKLRKNES